MKNNPDVSFPVEVIFIGVAVVLKDSSRQDLFALLS